MWLVVTDFQRVDSTYDKNGSNGYKTCHVHIMTLTFLCGGPEKCMFSYVPWQTWADRIHIKYLLVILFEGWILFMLVMSCTLAVIPRYQWKVKGKGYGCVVRLLLKLWHREAHRWACPERNNYSINWILPCYSLCLSTWLVSIPLQVHGFHSCLHWVYSWMLNAFITYGIMELLFAIIIASFL